MPDVLNFKIDKNEALRYFGVFGAGQENLEKIMDESIEDIKKSASISYAFGYFPLKLSGDVLIAGESLKLTGKSIKKYLADCDECFIFALTLGHEADRLISLTQSRDMVKALALDAAASAAVEASCEELEKIVREKAKINEKYITSRFSPGYGDLPLDTQDSLLALLNAQKKAGIYVNAHHMLIPSKTVTAIIGISNKETVKYKKCDICSNAKNCKFRKEGSFCEEN